jgi:glycosyltransferase involved in cell wall biosynthesis
MRVLHLNAGNLFGGIETLLLTLARHRDRCPEMEPHFALCFEGRLSAELRGSGVPVHPLGGVRISRPWTVWHARRRLRELLAEVAFDVVVCHGCWPHAVFAPVAGAGRLPVVFWAHDAPAGRHWLERWARRTRPELVLANSRWTMAAVPNLFPAVRAEVLYLPVAPPVVGRDERASCEVRAALNTPADATVIIQACRLERWKGHALLLQALAELAAVPGWVCWIAGGAQRPHEAEYLAELRQQAAALGIADRVRFLGQRADVPALLAAADIHCQPNTGSEPFGIAFVEALYARLPVVTTALGGALEIVDESCGILVPPADPRTLADALGMLVRQPRLRASFGEGGPARARLLCDPSRQLTRLRDLLDEMCRRKRPSGAPGLPGPGIDTTKQEDRRDLSGGPLTAAALGVDCSSDLRHRE